MGDVEAEDDVEEFPYLLKQLLQSGTKPEETVGCIDAFLAFSKRGCFACHHAGIEFSHFICDNPNCSASKNWCCHSCMVLRTTKKEKTYSEGWHCVGCDPLQQGKGKEFDVGSVTECRNVESKLVEQSFEPSGDSSLQSASGKCGPKSTDGPKRSKKQLLKKLIEIVTNDEYEKISFKGTYYDPNRLYEDHASKDYGTKQSIMAQLEDLSEAQLRLEIARYMHAKNTKLKESFIDTIRAEKTGEVGKKPDNAGKLPIKKIVYRLPLGPLEKLRSKLDQKTFILERAVELKSLMNGSSSSSGAAISSSEIEDLKSTIDQLKKQADNDREANEQDRAAEAAKMASLTEENRKIVKQNESLEDKTTRLEKENSDRQSDVHDLKSVVGDKESLIEQLQSQLFASDTRDHEIEAFKEAATTQQSLYLQEKANVDRMHDEYKALEEKHNETDQKLTTTRNENKALESENAALESKNAGLASTIDQLKMDMKAMMTGDRNNNGSEEEEEEGKDDDEEDEEEEADEKDGPKTWQEKCAEPGWTTNHSHVGKRVAKYFPCLAEGRKGQQKLYFGEVVRYLPHSEEKKEEESFMVSYEDNDYEEYYEQELLDMINLLMGPAAAEATTPAPALVQLTADNPNAGNTGSTSRKPIKKRQRSDSAFSEDDEAKSIPNWTTNECYRYCTLSRRFMLALDYPEPVDLPEDKQKLNSLYEEWTAKLRETLGFVDGESPHLKKYRSATGNEEQKNGSSKNRGSGGY